MQLNKQNHPAESRVSAASKRWPALASGLQDQHAVVKVHRSWNQVGTYIALQLGPCRGPCPAKRASSWCTRTCERPELLLSGWLKGQRTIFPPHNCTRTSLTSLKGPWSEQGVHSTHQGSRQKPARKYRRLSCRASTASRRSPSHVSTGSISILASGGQVPGVKKGHHGRQIGQRVWRVKR